MGNTAFTTTEGANVLLDILADRVERPRQRNLVFGRVYTDAARAYPVITRVRGFQDLQIPFTAFLNSGATRSLAEGNDTLLVYDIDTPTTVALTIDQHEYQAIEVEDFLDALSPIDFEAEYLVNIGETIARDEDAFLAGFPDGATSTVGTLGMENSEDELLEAMQTLLDADVPQSDISWVFSERAWTRLFAQVKYTSMDFHNGRPVDSGQIQALYAYPIFHSPNVEGTNAAGHDNTLAHRSAVAWHRVGNAPRTRPVMSENNLSDKVSISNIYGATEVRGDHHIFLRGA